MNTSIAAAGPARQKLPDERPALVHRFKIGWGHEAYVTVGLYKNGAPGELFLAVYKEGSTISGFADAFARAVSYCLQYGVPLETLVNRFSHMRFEPSGMTDHQRFGFAKSIVDYVFRWLDLRFGSVAKTSKRLEVERRRPPEDRRAISHEFYIGGHQGHVTVGRYEDGKPADLFLVMVNESSMISGFADAFAAAITIALQYGVPLETLVDKFSHMRFDPSGMTPNPKIRFAKSIADYVFRWLAIEFLSPDARFCAGVNGEKEPARGDRICEDCDAVMYRNGHGYKCPNCGMYVPDP